MNIASRSLCGVRGYILSPKNGRVDSKTVARIPLAINYYQGMVSFTLDNYKCFRLEVSLSSWNRLNHVTALGIKYSCAKNLTKFS